MGSTTQEKGYQGWANYETWCVNLWLSNDQGLYNATQEIVREAIAGDSVPDWQQASAAQAIQEFVESFPEVEAVTEQASFVSDLLRASLSEVDWYEIAGTWMEELES